MANRWIFTVKEGTGVTGLFPVGMKPEVVIDLDEVEAIAQPVDGGVCLRMKTGVTVIIDDDFGRIANMWRGI